MFVISTNILWNTVAGFPCFCSLRHLSKALCWFWCVTKSCSCKDSSFVAFVEDPNKQEINSYNRHAWTEFIELQHVRKLASWFCHHILYSWWGEGCSQERQGAPTDLPQLLGLGQQRRMCSPVVRRMARGCISGSSLKMLPLCVQTELAGVP